MQKYKQNKTEASNQTTSQLPWWLVRQGSAPTANDLTTNDDQVTRCLCSTLLMDLWYTASWISTTIIKQYNRYENTSFTYTATHAHTHTHTD